MNLESCLLYWPIPQDTRQVHPVYVLGQYSTAAAGTLRPHQKTERDVCFAMESTKTLTFTLSIEEIGIIYMSDCPSHSFCQTAHTWIFNNLKTFKILFF